jgi:hypothetical protein
VVPCISKSITCRFLTAKKYIASYDLKRILHSQQRCCLISSLGPFQPPAWKQAPLVSADRLDPFLFIVVIGTGLFVCK